MKLCQLEERYIVKIVNSYLGGMCFCGFLIVEQHQMVLAKILLIIANITNVNGGNFG